MLSSPAIRALRRTVAAALVFLASVSSHATIGLGLQRQTGNPSNATVDASNHIKYLIDRAQYAMDYNDTTREPNWVSWNLTSADVGSSGRSNFIVDTALPAGFYQVLTTDYSGSGYDRGHLCPSGDRTITTADNQVVFTMSNMMPQAPDNNQGVWASFETYCRTLAAAGNEILIITGPSGFAGSTIASGVSIPGYTWKIAVVVPSGVGTALTRITSTTRVIAIKVPNIAGVRNNPWENYVTSAAQIESDTGFSFFSALPAATANALRVMVDGQSAAGAPVITGQPSGQVAAVGGSASFSVTAGGDPTLLYQWLKEDVEIPGATTATLNLTNVQADAAATYTVVVTNGVGSVTSAGAALVITGLPPVIVTAPVAHAADAGTTTSFSVVAGGSPTLTYQWSKGVTPLLNGGNVSGATGPTLVLTNVQAGDAANYSVVVTNSVSSAASVPVALAVTPRAPVITAQPAPQTVAVGGTAVFTVTATGTANFTYAWRKGGVPVVNGVNISGASGPTLTITNAQNGDAGNYDVVVSNGVAPDATSTAAALNVNTVVAGRLSYKGGTYTQNFDTLPASGTTTFTGLTAPFDLAAAPANAAGMPGWTLASTVGTPSLIAGTGSGNAGAAYSFGASGSTERALGSVGSGSVAPRFGLTLVNDTGTTITQFTLAYTGEQWRHGGAAAPNKLTFTYAVGGTNLNTGTFVAAAALDFTGLITTTTASALDGNLAANRTAAPLSSTITGLTWLPGQTLVLRWSDVDDAGSDDGLAIDDLSFTTPVAAPPPPPVTPVVASTSPANGAAGVAPAAPITVTFNTAVTVSGSWFSINSAGAGLVPATVNVSADAKTFTLTPPVGFAQNDTITVTLVAAQIADQASGTLHPAANTVFSFTTSAPVAPSIAVQPLPQTVAAGGTASFSVLAAGSAPFSYQWRKGGAPVAGNPSAGTATLVITNAQAVDLGNYDVVVSNGTNPPATSNAVALTVTPTAPVITTQPVAQSVATGATVTLTVAATGTTPFSYQWRKGGVPLANGGIVSGAGTATLVLAGVTPFDAGSYDVVVTNGVNPAATSTAVAVAVAPPAIRFDYAGADYLQSFDTLPSAGTFTFAGAGPFALNAASPGINATGLAGWSVAKSSGSGANVLFKFDNGASNSGSAVSYGTTGASDRALGSLASGTMASRFGVTLLNTTNTTITYFTLSYTGEQWRHGGATTPNKLTFSYAVGGSGIGSGNFVNAPALDFTAPIATAATLVLDGNLAANRVTNIAATIAGLNWAPGQTLVLRWTDVDDGGSDDGLAIDDLVFSVAPPVPVITTQPVAVTVPAFTPASFTVAARSTTPQSYQWRRNNVDITGNASAQTATLVLPSATAALAGSYTCNVTNDYGSTLSAAASLQTNKVPAAVNLQGLVVTYDGAAKSPVAVTVPAGLAVDLTFPGTPTPPVNAGSYAVVATINDPDYTGSASDTLVIAPAPVVVSLSNLDQVYNGFPRPATVGTAPAGISCAVTYDGAAPVPVNAGSYAVVATVNNPNYIGAASGTLVVRKAPALVALSRLVQAYDGTPKAVTVSTTPTPLSVVVTYDGAAALPVNPGRYAVVATVQNANFAGSAAADLLITVTSLVRHAPSFSGGLDGSMQVLLPESIAMNGNAWVSGDILVPGTPEVVLNGRPTYAGTLDGTGAAQPADHRVVLNGNVVLRHVIRRTDALVLPVVAAPPAPAGTRTVTLNSANDSAGDFATVRNLTAKTNAGQVAVPPGTYGTFTAGNKGGFTLGIADATVPAVYHFQSLAFSGSAQLEVVGPVIVTLANGTTFSGSTGSAAHPEWLTLNVAAGDVTVAQGATLHGRIIAPAGLVTIGGTVHGGVASDRLTIAGTGLLDEATP